MKRILLILISYEIAFFLLLSGYYYYIVPIYGYSGFEWLPNTAKIFVGVIITLIVSSVLPTNFIKPSDIFLHLQLLLPILPMLVLYGAADLPGAFVFFTMIAFSVIVLLTRTIKLKAFKVVNISPIFLQRLLILISVLYIFSIIAFGGLRFLNFDFSHVYELRPEAATALPGIYAYFSPMVSKVLLPFSLLLAIVNKDKILAIVAITCSVFMFALTTHKGPLFYPIVILVLYYILQSRNVIQMLLFGYISVIVVSILGFITGGLGDWVGSLFLRRTYFVPANINFLYYDFFTNNPYVMWAQSKFTLNLLDYPYAHDVPHLIGLEYYSNEETGANTGWLGAGYMQLGLSGMLIYAIIIGLLFCLLDAYSKRINKRIIVATISIPILVVITSSDLPTAFLTHGVILSLILFSLFSKRPDKYNLQMTRFSLKRTLK